MDDGRSMRAVKDNLPTASGGVEESEGHRWTRAVKDSLVALLREDKKE